jgi:SAM-dependent methyltransferase
MNAHENQKMFRLEGQLWWYKILHRRVADAIVGRFQENKSLRIFDAGCGTGGLLDFLAKRGYTNLNGVDAAPDAVDFCQARGLNMTVLDLTDLANYCPGETFDVIICNDVFCYFNDAALVELLAQLGRRLAVGGLLVSNNNAFSVFRGAHDVAVGSLRRFVRADFDRLTQQTSLQISSATYWSFFLSPLILAVRQWQRLQLRLGWQHPDNAASDVEDPGAFANAVLYQIVRLETRLLPHSPFGSSLFMCLTKRVKSYE